MEEIIPFNLIKSFTFSRVPTSIPADLRPNRIISIILLILKLNCRSSKGSLLKIQFLCWVLKHDFIMDYILKNISDKEYKYSLPVVHLDPAINRAIQFSISDDLIAFISSGKIQITEKGDKYISEILKENNMFTKEIDFLKSLGKRISEIQISNILMED